MVDTKRIWVDGEIVDYEKATTHVLSFTLHYGLGTFEGIRCYRAKGGRPAVFRMHEHVERLMKSCVAATIDVPYTHQQLCEAILQVIRENQYGDCYIRPLIWLGEGSLSVGSTDNEVRVAIAAWPWGAYLGQEALEQGVRVCMSNYTRMSVAANLVKAKIVGQYVNGVLAKRDAKRNGYAEAILLDQQGYVTEGTGENIFVVRKGKIFTPPYGTSILAGITRDTLIELAKDEGIELEESLLTRSDLFFADEIFFTGTAAEVTPVREIDGRRIGSGTRGPITERLQKRFFASVRGENKKREAWLTYV
jgi:branched-chain amino acid aminotransferase